MTQRYPLNQTILSAKATTGTGTAVSVQDFKNIQLEVSTASSGNLTVKIQGSMAITQPDFSTSASTSNPWDYIACYDLNDPSTIITGSTGVVASGTDICKNLLVNVDGLSWISATVTARSAGNVTVKVLAFNNQ